MSTRHARTADKSLNEKHARILKELLQKPANKYCADYTRWASWNLGLFVCIRCSGVHRSMGTHISKAVKSVDLDTWIPEQVENMIKWGNERANLYWEAHLSDKQPQEGNIDMWIRTKYEQKKWAMKGPMPDPSTLGGVQEVDTVTHTSSPPVNEKKSASSEFANFDVFFNATHAPLQKSNSAIAQLQGADFFTSAPKAPTADSSTTTSPYHDTLKSSILSLYGKPPVHTSHMPLAHPSYQQSTMMAPQSAFPQTQPDLFSQGWGSLATPPVIQQHHHQGQAPSHSLPQGSGFFSMPPTTTTTTNTTNTTNTKNPAYE
ncbi:putative GTPase activating protein for Arf-domain-containing protein [Spinellus fusiger]|nr:putative GTPase activating protein for Arf-domain-containing protein [Spinellus fusiger]